MDDLRLRRLVGRDRDRDERRQLRRARYTDHAQRRKTQPLERLVR
jgi:hypothetical protein